MAEKLPGQSEPQSEPGDSNTPEYITKDQIGEIVSQIVNSAMTSRNKSFEKKFEEMMTKVSVPVESKPEKEEPVSKAEMMAMRKQLAEYAAKDEATTAKERDQKLRETTKEHLTKIGVPTHLLKGAVATLVDADKLVFLNEDGELKFKSSIGEVDMDQGVKQWSKSTDGKAFLPPKGAQGSGDRSLQKPSPTKTNLSDNDMVNLLKELKG